MGLHLAQDDAADAFLDRDPLALLTAMLLDQQVPLEWAFSAPYRLAERLGMTRLDAAMIAAHDPGELIAVFTGPPALHRFPKAMAERTQKLARMIVAEYGGEADAVWRDAPSGAELLKRVGRLPGFGRQKAQIFVALLGKQLGVQPRGWRQAAGEFGVKGSFKSVADIVDEASLVKVRQYKKDMKTAAKANG